MQSVLQWVIWSIKFSHRIQSVHCKQNRWQTNNERKQNHSSTLCTHIWPIESCDFYSSHTESIRFRTTVFVYIIFSVCNKNNEDKCLTRWVAHFVHLAFNKLITLNLYKFIFRANKFEKSLTSLLFYFK